jgi:hypothetical protein
MCDQCPEEIRSLPLVSLDRIDGFFYALVPNSYYQGKKGIYKWNLERREIPYGSGNFLIFKSDSPVRKLRLDSAKKNLVLSGLVEVVIEPHPVDPQVDSTLPVETTTFFVYPDNVEGLIYGDSGEHRYEEGYDEIDPETGEEFWVPANTEILCCGRWLQVNEFTNTCPTCHQDYGPGGWKCSPREQWGEETGEYF